MHYFPVPPYERGWNWMTFKVLSSTNHSLILWFLCTLVLFQNTSWRFLRCCPEHLNILLRIECLVFWGFFVKKKYSYRKCIFIEVQMRKWSSNPTILFSLKIHHYLDLSSLQLISKSFWNLHGSFQLNGKLWYPSHVLVQSGYFFCSGWRSGDKKYSVIFKMCVHLFYFGLGFFW